MNHTVSEHQLRYMEFVQRENGVHHQSVAEDQIIYEYIKAGDLRSLDALEKVSQLTGASHCSDDPLRNAKYLFVANVTLAGRAAMSAGMDAERSNIASDLFIQRMDKMTSIEQIGLLNREVIRFYTLEVAALDKKRTFSRNVDLALDYIYNHLHEPLTVDSVASRLGLSRGYFSTLFKQEMGLSCAEYILKKRIEAARNMLRFTNMSSSEIGHMLSFSSQSHFIQAFKKSEGMTPREYRENVTVQ